MFLKSEFLFSTELNFLKGDTSVYLKQITLFEKKRDFVKVIHIFFFFFSIIFFTCSYFLMPLTLSLVYSYIFLWKMESQKQLLRNCFRQHFFLRVSVLVFSFSLVVRIDLLVYYDFSKNTGWEVHFRFIFIRL